MKSQKNSNKSGHLFTVEILLEELSNGLALEKLLQTLNQSDSIKDYKILSGIELGKLIEANKTSDRPVTPARNTSSAASASTASTASSALLSSDLIEQVERLKRENTLVRLTIVKARGPKYDIPCRILHCDPVEEIITTYHVDDKKVYTFKFNEIDNFEIS